MRPNPELTRTLWLIAWPSLPKIWNLSWLNGPKYFFIVFFFLVFQVSNIFFSIAWNHHHLASYARVRETHFERVWTDFETTHVRTVLWNQLGRLGILFAVGKSAYSKFFPGISTRKWSCLDGFRVAFSSPIKEIQEWNLSWRVFTSIWTEIDSDTPCSRMLPHRD